jgi:hypothetical protein
MFRRWLIRSLALTLLTLCVLAWVGTYWMGAGVTYRGKKEYELGVLNGIIYGGNLGAISPWKLPQGVHVYRLRHLAGFALGAEDKDFEFLKFWCLINPLGVEVGIPLYFPTLLSAILLWFAWRKTRAKPSGGAFPVEVAAKTEAGQI